MKKIYKKLRKIKESIEELREELKEVKKLLSKEEYDSGIEYVMNLWKEHEKRRREQKKEYFELKKEKKLTGRHERILDTLYMKHIYGKDIEEDLKKLRKKNDPASKWILKEVETWKIWDKMQEEYRKLVEKNPAIGVEFVEKCIEEIRREKKEVKNNE